MTMSRSSPSLAASFNLREHSQTRRKIALDRPSSQPSFTYEEIDLLGGNGRWRQRKADQFFKQKEVEELERQRQEREIEERKRRRRQEIEARRKRQQQEEEQKREAERERERREREYKEEVRRREEEAERIKWELEQREWEARQPYCCESCQGTGKCTRCQGSGKLFAMFLVSTVDKRSHMPFGRTPQGCEDCGGCRQNIMGDLALGTGHCPRCNGKGKVWPKAAFEYKASKSQRLNRAISTVNSEALSPKSAMSSPKVASFNI
mmetsp:Transcript_96756/g.190062  ORF Transcript_96756/g.190062 Transcript_96756/m.190062 type:complete len:264 (-) Transcript_96756:246-1037(-)